MNQIAIQKKILEHTSKDKKGNVFISLENSRLDFEQKYLFLGFTCSGKVKLGEIIGWNKGKVDFYKRFGKVDLEEGLIKIHTDGYRYSKRIKIGGNK